MPTRSAKVRRPPRWYFSLRSPYSWLAYRDVMDRHREIADRLQWLPFWEPDELSEAMLRDAGGEFFYTDMSRAKHLYILQDVRRLAAMRGLAITWPVDRLPCWEVPHLAYLVADRRGRGREFVELAYRTRWQEGRDICDRRVMAEIAGPLGLPPDELANASDDTYWRQQGLQALLAIYRDGVFGVPFFIAGFEKFWGVDRLEAFVASLSGTTDGPDRRPEPAAAAGGLARTTDGGHAGGCG